MRSETLFAYRYVLAFLGLGLVFALISVLLPRLLAPRGPRRPGGRGRAAGEADGWGDALKTYESGIVPQRGAWRQFPLAYYLFALLYLAVAVDVIYLFPVALVLRSVPGWQPLVEVLVFVAVLVVALLYAWRTGVFRWED